MHEAKLFNSKQGILWMDKQAIKDHHKYSEATNMVGYIYNWSPNCADADNIKDCSL